MKKLIMYQKAIAYLEDEMMYEFDKNCGVVNFAAWVRQKAKEDFDLEITSADDIEKLSAVCQSNWYKDKSEWLRNKIREEIKGNLKQKIETVIVEKYHIIKDTSNELLILVDKDKLIKNYYLLLDSVLKSGDDILELRSRLEEESSNFGYDLKDSIEDGNSIEG